MKKILILLALILTLLLVTSALGWGAFNYFLVGDNPSLKDIDVTTTETSKYDNINVKTIERRENDNRSLLNVAYPVTENSKINQTLEELSQAFIASFTETALSQEQAYQEYLAETGLVSNTIVTDYTQHFDVSFANEKYVSFVFYQYQSTGGTGLDIFGNERHQFDRLALFRGRRSNTENSSVRSFRNPDEFVFLIRIASTLTGIAIKQSRHPTVIDTVKVGRQPTDDEMTNLLLVLLLQRSHRNDAFLWKHAIVLHDFVEHHLVNVSAVMSTGSPSPNISLRQEETQGEGVLRRDGAVDLPDSILLRILTEFLKKYTTDTFTPCFLADDQRTDLDCALVLGHEVEDTHNEVVLCSHIHQLFSRKVTLLVLVAFGGSFDDALCVRSMIATVERIKMCVHHLRHDRQIIKPNSSYSYHCNELLSLICCREATMTP